MEIAAKIALLQFHVAFDPEYRNANVAKGHNCAVCSASRNGATFVQVADFYDVCLNNLREKITVGAPLLAFEKWPVTQLATKGFA